MKHAGLLLLVLAALTGLANQVAAFAATPPNVTADIVASGLGFVSSFRFLPDGRVMVLSLNDRSISTIRLPYPSANQNKTLWYAFTDIIATPNAGPFGVTVDPKYAKNKFVYIYVAGRNISGRVVNQIIRFTDINGQGKSPKVIFTVPTPGAIKEEGGFLNFGPDGKLWFVVGQGTIEGNPAIQNITEAHGKVHRINADGSIPKDNPFRGNSVWAWGIRNAFGFAFDPMRPKSLAMWETENGDTCNDELNYVQKKNNLGYGPIRNCSQPLTIEKTNANGVNIVMPKWVFNGTPRSPSPTGAIFCNKCNLGLNGQLLVGFFQSFDIKAFKLDAARTSLTNSSVVYVNDASIIGVRSGPMNAVYFSDYKQARGSYIKVLKSN